MTRRAGTIVGVLAGAAILLPTLAGCGQEHGGPSGTLRTVSDTAGGGNDIGEGWVFTLPAEDDANWDPRRRDGGASVPGRARPGRQSCARRATGSGCWGERERGPATGAGLPVPALPVGKWLYPLVNELARDGVPTWRHLTDRRLESRAWLVKAHSIGTPSTRSVLRMEPCHATTRRVLRSRSG